MVFIGHYGCIAKRNRTTETAKVIRLDKEYGYHVFRTHRQHQFVQAVFISRTFAVNSDYHLRRTFQLTESGSHVGFRHGIDINIRIKPAGFCKCIF